MTVNSTNGGDPAPVLFAVVKHTRTIGASEDLVVAAASRLARLGRPTAVWFSFVPPPDDWRIASLQASGCRVFLFNHSSRSRRIARRVLPSTGPAALRRSLLAAVRTSGAPEVLLNQGGNSDAHFEASVLASAGIPYRILSHNATAATWPNDSFRPAFQALFARAIQCLFVSRENRDLTEAQAGFPLPDPRVVWNPCRLIHEKPRPSCDASTSFALASVSRLSAKQKGHDLLIQSLASPVWRERDWSLTFYGDGPDSTSLQSLARSRCGTRVSFAGNISDVAAVWDHHHFFVQASRYEGYGLSLVEAMFCGRGAIATRFPASEDFVHEGQTGFLAGGSNRTEVAAALNRAWESRYRWREIGEAAHRVVAAGWPADPVGDLVELLSAAPTPQ